MTDIAPPPELVEQWRTAPEYTSGSKKLMMVTMTTQRLQEITIQAARWGADQELEACCEWIDQNTGRWDLLAELRTARRPKPSIPNEIRLTSGNEAIRVTTGGFFYNEQHIEDGGEAHYLLVEFLKRAMPDVAWRHADD